MDTIDGALKSKDGQHKFHPETTIQKVIGLEAELAKAITNLTANGGMITITKADGSTTDITIATSTSAGGGGGVTGVKGNAESTYRTGNVNITPANIGAASTDIATATKAGLMSAEMFDKLDKIESGAQKNSTALATTTSNGLMSFEDKTLLNNLSSSSVTGVKGSSESSYHTGNVNITAANVGAAAASHVHSAGDITSGILSTARGGTGQTSLSSVSVGSAATCTGNSATATKATQDESGNNIKASYAASISISDHTITLKNKNGASLGTVTVPDNNTTYSAATSSTLGLVKTGNNITNSSGTISLTKANVTSALGYTPPTQDTNTTDLTQMTGILPIAKGGTAITSNPSMLTNLASTAAASVFAASPRPGVTGILPIANGGTGNANGYAKWDAVVVNSSTNIDQLDAGTYQVNQSMKIGSLTASTWLLMVVKKSGTSYAFQILSPVSDISFAPEIYYRRTYSSAWKEWRKIALSAAS